MSKKQKGKLIYLPPAVAATAKQCIIHISNIYTRHEYTKTEYNLLKAILLQRSSHYLFTYWIAKFPTW